MKQSEVRENADKIEAYLLETDVPHRLSTCTEWESDGNKNYIIIRPTVEELRNCGYLVKTEIRWGVTDFYVYPKIIQD